MFQHCEKTAACGQILPILNKLKDHVTVKDDPLLQPASKKVSGVLSPSVTGSVAVPYSRACTMTDVRKVTVGQNI